MKSGLKNFIIIPENLVPYQTNVAPKGGNFFAIVDCLSNKVLYENSKQWITVEKEENGNFLTFNQERKIKITNICPSIYRPIFLVINLSKKEVRYCCTWEPIFEKQNERYQPTCKTCRQ